MLGAYFSYSILRWTGQFWLCMIVAPMLVGVIGILMERFLLRQVHHHGHAHELLLTFGFAYIVEEVVKWIWGNQPLHVEIPAILAGSVQFLGITYPTYRLFILVVSAFVFVVLFLILYKTRAGIIVTAAVSRSEMVNALGINVPLVFMLLFGVGGALAGLAGVIGGPRHGGHHHNRPVRGRCRGRTGLFARSAFSIFSDRRTPIFRYSVDPPNGDCPGVFAHGCRFDFQT
jgi:branched-chain amino acid transport system permease protein